MGVATNSTRVPHEVQWPQTVHVPPVLHAVASCALLAQLVLLYMKGAEKKIVADLFLRLPGATLIIVG